MHKYLNRIACGLFFWLCVNVGANAGSATLDQALSSALNYSAELSANSHQVNALNNMADSAMQLPDPKLQVGIENVPVGGDNSHRLTREGMTMQKVGVMQQYVSSAKRESKSDAIKAEASKTAANSAVIQAKVQRETAQAWFDLALSEKTLTAINAVVAETSRQTAVQTSGVASGSTSASSVLDIQLALNAMKNEQDNARRDIQIAQAKLTKLTGENITATSGKLPRIERLPADEKTLMAGVDQHPEIIQALREADSAKAKSNQSALAAIPDVGVEVYYAKRADGMDDMAGVMLTVDLPLFQGSRQDKDHAADVSRTYQANDQLAQLKRDHQSELSALISQYQAAKSIYERQAKEVIPLLRAKIKLSEAQYRAGNSGLAEVLDARRALLNGEIAKHNAEKTLSSAWAAIRYLIPQEVK
ncbi:MAG: TolC family protein [Enterobacteriaceae bacterium]|jgi:outer membrane protein TolC|nr:TolC family protein [Enterobacteriaceae bacterium]